MSNNGLSGKFWPAYSKPQEDELLSSWLVRLAMAHGLKLHTFSSLAWPHKHIWNRDIDKSADESLLHVLSEKTPVPLDRVRDTTLSTYEGVLYERHNPFGNKFWIMPVSVYHCIRRNFGLQFCPYCLAEDKEPYFRRRWRLAFVVVCLQHKVGLRDRCPRCGEPVNFHRDELGFRRKLVVTSMTLCHLCKFDFRKLATEMEFENTQAETREVEIQEKLSDAMSKGWAAINGREAVYSHLYFRVLHQLMRILATGRQSRDLRAALSAKCGLPLFTPVFTRYSRDIERLDVCARRGLLMLAWHLLENWPQRFVEFYKENRVWSSTLLRDMRGVPFWYWNGIQAHLYRISSEPRRRLRL